ncbi:MAG: diaminopimelate epimerase [Betaproteobacteria bacterium]|jgi:diaminopimelate epimerase (EC 5.1.1.7)|nr:diaminopimelate epimerase [Betaproteobacteria bacterium]
MTALTFTKMQGLGNDFIMLEGVRAPLQLSNLQLRWLADRHFGIGCDQILWVEPPHSSLNDFRYRIFNQDGGEVANCGNGVRCFTRFVIDQGLTHKRRLRVETQSGILEPELLDAGQVRVNMGSPIFDADHIPFHATHNGLVHSLMIGDQQRSIAVLSMGNPHAVQLVSDVEQAPVGTEGPLLEAHPDFPERVNAGFMEVVDRDHIRLRVFERGAGETLACGTGACAAVVVGQILQLLNHTVTVQTRGGQLVIEWFGDNQPVWMTGPAVTVFSGTIVVPTTEELCHAGR